MLSPAINAGLIVTVLIALAASVRLWWLQTRVQTRVFETDELPRSERRQATDVRRSWLGQWLFIAGFRSPNATALFLVTTLVGAGIGGTIATACYMLGVVTQMVALMSFVPGGVGEVFLPFAYLAPWLSMALLTLLPAIVVRAARRRRVAAVEQDLPLMLDLLSTLAEAGLGFDAALDRILAIQPQHRPLVQEFRAFQVDVLGGRARVESLRRLAGRLQVTWFSIFITAIVQAEQIGAGIAEVLRVQADDLRQRRRERALALAMSVPVKLLFPLIICFLPGIFVAAAGPPFFQILQTLDNFLMPYRGV